MNDQEIKKYLTGLEQNLEISPMTMDAIKSFLKQGIDLHPLTSLYTCGVRDSHYSKDYQPPTISDNWKNLEQTKSKCTVESILSVQQGPL